MSEIEAKKRLQQLTKEKPTLAGPQINLGILLLAEEDLEGAESAFRSALQHNPKHAVAHNQLGRLLRRQGRFPAARDAYEAALLSDPDYTLAHRNIGILYDLYLGQPALALEHYKKYQHLTAEPDPNVDRWLVDLQRRSGSAQARTEQ